MNKATGKLPPQFLGQWQQLFGRGDYPACAALGNDLVARYPDDGKSWQLQGLALSFLGRHRDAIDRLRRATRLARTDASIWDALGIACLRAGEHDSAADAFRSSLRLVPSAASVWVNASNNEWERGNAQEALRLASRAAELAPNLPAAQLALGNALAAQGRNDEALPALQRALALAPRFAEAHVGLGAVLERLGQCEEAMAHYQQAVRLSPRLPVGYQNAGSLANKLGDLVTASAAYRRVIELAPDLAQAWTPYLHTLVHDDTVEPQDAAAQFRRFGEIAEAPFRAGWGGWPNPREAERPLRVGFVSGDLHGDHPVRFFVELAWRGLEREQVAIWVYHNNAREDRTSEHLKSMVESWLNVARLGDEALERRIREDAIDILVDISGHSAGSRLPVFARKPAPLQVSWLGFPSTTGLTAIDYKFVQGAAIPPGAMDPLYSEHLAHLRVPLLFEPSAGLPPVAPPPALARGHFTFGSFHRAAKINARTVALWSAALGQVEGSRMLIGGVAHPLVEARLRAAFARHGVDPGRLGFSPVTDLQDYLALHREIDLILDALPFSGGTTVGHALWMGVPTLTLAGPSPQQREAASHLQLAGLPDWIADTEQEFLDKAGAAAAAPERLAELRSGMREHLGQVARRRAVECDFGRALRLIWRHWCEGRAPAVLDLMSDPAGRFIDPD